MPEFLPNLLTNQFIPHGHCYLWKPGLVWLHIVSDLLIALAYYSIPIMLVYFVCKRRDLPHAGMFLMFGTFIVACGTTHLMEIWTLWHPTYWLSGLLKAITAMVSVCTAVELVPLIPKALALPSPAQLEAANVVLQNEIKERLLAQGALSRIHNDLELRVGERTLELAAANQRLQEEEDRYRSLMLATTQIIWTNSADGKMTGEQPGWAAFTGQTHEQYQNFGWSAALYPDDVEHTINQWNRAVSMCTLFEVEHRVRRSDGEYRHFSVRAAPVLNTDGSIREWVGAHTDITERKQIELEMRQSEQRYRFLADAMPQIVWTALSNGYLNYYNRRWYEFTGFMEGAGGDDSWKPILHPDDVELCLNLWYRSVHTGEAYEIECRFIDRKTGNYRWHLGRALPMRNQAGEIVLWAGTCTDVHDYKEAQNSLLEAQQSLELKVQERTTQLQAEIAERQQAQAALQASEAELRVLFAAMTDVVLVRDAQGRCLRILPTKPMNLYKKSVAEMIGKTLHETFPRSEADTLLGYIRQALNTQKTVYGEYSLMIEGQEVYFSANFSPISSDSVMLVARDITERQQVQEELLKAKEGAEAANRSKSEFLANMSHEIRTPMNGVIGMTGMLLDTDLAPQQRDFVETIRSSGDALLTIINDILDFSKIEAGKLELEEHPFDLRMCVESALDLLAPQAAAKNLDLGYLMDPQTPGWIVGDSVRLRQILVNLLANAVKFTEVGEVVLSVTAEELGSGEDTPTPYSPTPVLETGCGWLCQPEQVSGRLILPENSRQNWRRRAVPSAAWLLPTPPFYKIQFAVKDTGIGIPTERMERLFKPFSQVDTSTTRQYGGTGLGLAISWRLSEMMGGRMWVESTEGVGSTFYFTVTAKLAPDSAVVDLDVVSPGLAGLRLLVVDDNATNRKILTLQAESWGMHIRAAESANQALEWLGQSEQFDIAVLDMQMTDINGLSLATQVHSLPGYQELPLVMLSSVGKPIPEELGATNDFVACLTKPIKQSQLYNVLVWFFSQQSVCMRPAAPSSPQLRQLAQELPLRILLVEDLALNQKVALLMLQQLGYSADVANNGLEALDALRRQEHDVVFMDVQMPEMDGLEATRWLTEQSSTPSRPWIIAMTAHAMQGDRQQCLQAGMNDYISKPVRLEAIAQALNNYRHLRGSDEWGGALPPTPSIDLQVLQALKDMVSVNAASVLAEMIEIYLEDAPPRLQAINQAVVDTDATALEKSAHALRSMSLTVGAIPVSQLCATLEAMGRAGTTVGTEVLVKQLQAEYERLEAALQLEYPGRQV